MTVPPQHRLEWVAVADLRPARRNPKLHDLDGIRRSIGRFGFVEKPLVDERTGLLLAGHGRQEALSAMETAPTDEERRAGPPRGVRVGDDGRWRVQVVRGWASRDDAEAEAYLVASNRLTETGGWDRRGLAEILRDLAVADAELPGDAGFGKAELDSLLSSLNVFPPQAGDDDVPPGPDEPLTRLGDLWVLGRHRLICGDGTDHTVLDLLTEGKRPDALLTDPPYGMHLDTDYSTIRSSPRAQLQRPGKQHRPVQGDDSPFDARPVYDYCRPIREQFWFGADYYRLTIPEPDGAGSWLVWDKRNEASDAVVGSGFELVWSRAPHKRDLLRHYHCGAFGADARDRVHPTQKPVPLLAEIIDRWVAAEGAILDPYGGSGSTLIAAERTGRRAFLVEIDAAYCDVIVARWEKATGATAERVPAGERVGVD